MKNKLLYTTILGVFALILSSASAQTSPDAIAIRIMQNPNHYSALRWYQEKHFTGSPQSVVVDGYNGVRDGRTVYVNVANVNGNNFYTNIYLISYNQDAEDKTVDIFGKMVDHWRFNTNIDDKEEKAEIVRDTLRMEKLGNMQYILNQYRITKGSYPDLKAGSYVKNVTLSVWPSWQETFAAQLKTSLPVDPKNKLGTCGSGADLKPNALTCWDEDKKIFADKNPSDSEILLPDDSMVFMYRAIIAADNSITYVLTAPRETDYIIDSVSGFEATGGYFKITPP